MTLAFRGSVFNWVEESLALSQDLNLKIIKPKTIMGPERDNLISSVVVEILKIRQKEPIATYDV